MKGLGPSLSALASPCPRIVSKRFSPRAPSPSSARRRARHRRGAPCSKIFSAAGFLALSTWSIRATTKSRAFAPSNPMTPCRRRPMSSLSRCRRPRCPMRLPPPRAKAPQSASSLPQGSAMAPARSPMLCEKNARAAGMRLVGPNCLGVLVPGAKLNASFAAAAAAARRSRAHLAIRRHRGWIGAMGCRPRRRLFRHRLDRR